MSGLLLEIVEGPGTGDRLPLDTTVELGRDPSLPHALDDVKVSRHHARVSATGSSASVEDLGSTNGTFLNDSPLEIATAIKPGDRIRVGFTVLELRQASDPTPVAPAPRLPEVGADVLAPVPSRELPEVAPPPEPEYGAVRVPSSEPHYVNTRVAQRIDELSPPRGGTPPPPPGAGLEAPAPPPTPAPASTGDPADEENYRAIAHLIDSRVKSRTNTAAFALLAIAALAVIIYFGAR